MAPDARLVAVRRLVTYDRKAFESFERSIERLGWKEATANREVAHRSLKDTLVHILNVHEAWLVAAAQDRWEEVFRNPIRRGSAIHSFADLRRYRNGVWEGIDRLMEGLTSARIGRRVKVPWIAGRYTLEDAFYQTSFEQAHHLGEVIAVYWQMNKVPPQMMWIPLLTGVRVSVR
jgi:uncharacterized damage-inducible protein DinB